MEKYIPSFQTVAKGSFYLAAGLTAVAGTLLYYGQNYLIYPASFPQGSRTFVATPGEFNVPYEELTLVTPDGVKIRGYLMRQRAVLPHELKSQQVESHSELSDDEFASTRPTIMMYHGNAGNIGHRLPLARLFYAKMRCNVVSVSYRGYGLSEGSPSEKGLRIDAQTTLNWVLEHPILGNTKVVVYGQSIGGAVSIDLASRNLDTIRGVIVENTFLSIPRLVPSVIPMLSPFIWLCHQHWDNARAVTRIPPTTPMLFLSGLRDEIVPPSHMSELFRVACTNGEKGRTWVDFPDGAHNDTCAQAGYWTAVTQFLKNM